MRYRRLNNVLDLSKKIIDEFVEEGFVVIDATLGNGYDSLLLKNKIGKSGSLYGFDIQDKAIENSRELLNSPAYDNIFLIKDSHENFKDYIDERVDFIIYNLGYLPGGDKSIATDGSSTVRSIEIGMDMLKENGLMLVAVYPGHEEGYKEYEMVKSFFEKIDQRSFNILEHKFINQKNNPPILYELEKAKK